MQPIFPCETTLSSKGQVVIPRAIRDAAGWHEGLKFRIRLKENGGAELLPKQSLSISDIFGILHKPGARAWSPDEIDEAIMREVAADDARIRNSHRSKSSRKPRKTGKPK